MNLFSQSLRIHVAELGTPRPALDDIASGSPWWLAPLPRSAMDSCTVSREDLSRAIGWGRRRRGDALVSLFAVAAIALQVRFCWLESIICQYAEISSAHAWAVQIAMVALLMATMWALWYWIRPALLSDRFANEPRQNVITRRDWIAGAVPAVPTIALLFLLPRSPHAARSTTAVPKLKRHDNPRFVQGHKTSSVATTLAPGFHENPIPKIIHWVSPSREIRRVSKINQAALRPSSDSQPVTPAEKKPRVHLATASYALGSEAKRLLKAKDYVSACNMLVIGIEHDALLRSPAASKTEAGNRVRRRRKNEKPDPSQAPRPLAPKRPDFRIFDLLADIAAQNDQRTFLERAAEELSKAKGSYLSDSFAAREIDARIAKWTNPASPWNLKRVPVTK
jgi:hypothetical protein